MSRRQQDACAARMPPAQALEFSDLLSAADALFMSSVRLRRRAWEMYRQAVPDAARGPRLLASKPPGEGRA